MYHRRLEGLGFLFNLIVSSDLGSYCWVVAVYKCSTKRWKWNTTGSHPWWKLHEHLLIDMLSFQDEECMGTSLYRDQNTCCFSLHVESPSPNCDYPIWRPKTMAVLICLIITVFQHCGFSVESVSKDLHSWPQINIFKGSGWHCVMRCLLFNYFVWNTQFMSHWIPNSYPVEWCRCSTTKKPSAVDNPCQS